MSDDPALDKLVEAARVKPNPEEEPLVAPEGAAYCSTFRCIVADPPWEMGKMGTGRDTRPGRKYKIGHNIGTPYPTMTLDEICAMPIGKLAAEDCHLWLWTTNKHLESGFRIMREWGFRYLAPIHFIKPAGIGCWWIHRTQTLLHGYKSRCVFSGKRYLPNILNVGQPKRHSEKWTESYRLIESVSAGPRLELFARRKRHGWASWGNEIANDIEIPNAMLAQREKL